jgi:ribonuclease HI
LHDTSKILIYTDGASRGNPGPGGYGVVLIWGQVTALEAMKKNHLPLQVYTDSNYVVKACEEGWLTKWIKTDFKGGKKNKDLWLRYYKLSQNHRISFKWVKGHHVDVNNIRCDKLATEAADGNDLLIDEGYESELRS